MHLLSNFKQIQMKKIILVGMLVLGISTVQAQQSEKGTIEIVPQIGYSISNFSGSDASNSGALSSLVLKAPFSIENGAFNFSKSFFTNR
jgi:hypothetical protein